MVELGSGVVEQLSGLLGREGEQRLVVGVERVDKRVRQCVQRVVDLCEYGGEVRLYDSQLVRLLIGDETLAPLHVGCCDVRVDASGIELAGDVVPTLTGCTWTRLLCSYQCTGVTHRLS